MNSLEKALANNGRRIGTGYLSRPFTLPALTVAGKLDAAFKVLENEDCPGWLYAPRHGVTTIWENWEGYDKDGHPKESRNRYTIGAVCEWLFKTVGDINIAGENEFLTAPHIDGSLIHVRASYKSVFGEVSSGWEIKNDPFLLKLAIPCNCSAIVVIPNGETNEVDGGCHSKCHCNRDFFPDHLITEARKDILALFQEMQIEAVMLGENETKLGSVETYSHSKACAELFKANRERIDGVLVVLPNFGDEKGVADTIELSGLNVPILVQAYPDDLDAFNVERRRDAFCGKISVCNNLRQYGYDFSLTSLHTSRPTSASFKQDLAKFLGVCRVVKGLRNARLGAIGARPGAFNTVRYSEKLLQATGITVTTVDLSELLGKSGRLSDDAPSVKAKLESIHAYAKHDTVPSPALVRMAKLGIVIDDWMQANDLQATALQCWTSLQQNYGINACTLMSMMSDQLMPSACETDITGVVSMYALQLASSFPGALVDWNNNYADDPDRSFLFHCGNWAKSFVPEIEIKTAPILGSTLGEENTFGAMAGRAAAGPMTYARVSTDDTYDVIRAYTGEGELTNDTLETFGHHVVVHVPELQKLLAHLCRTGFEHHVAMTMGSVAPILTEALSNYMKWDVYHHQ